MNKKKFEIFLNISSSKMSIGIFDNFEHKITFFKEYYYQNNLDIENLDFTQLEKNIENNILEIEKFTGEFLNELNIMIDTPSSDTISLSLSKNNEGKKIYAKDIQYLAQDAKQQIIRSNNNKDIIHIIINNYLIDEVKFIDLPENTYCKKLFINFNFIFISKILKKKVEQLFANHQIVINKFICSNYARSIICKDSNKNISQIGKEIIDGANKSEILIVPKITEKKGFFERLFYLFE